VPISKIKNTIINKNLSFYMLYIEGMYFFMFFLSTAWINYPSEFDEIVACSTIFE